jgi:hypothetical protein
MINTLISLDTSLASQIALRFCCRMAKMVPMDIRSIHIEECSHEASAPGTGWVRQTWESSSLETARNEIINLVEAVSSACPISRVPKLAMGDPDEEIYRELDSGRYDLFVEGMLQNFDPSSFSEKIKTQRFYRSACPVLLVKNMPAFRKAALLLTPGDRPGPLVDAFGKLFPKNAMAIDVIEVKNGSGLGTVSAKRRRQNNDDIPVAVPEMDPDIAGRLAEQGWTLRDYIRVGELRETAGLLRNYSLVASYLPSDSRRGNPLVKVLNQVPTANLLCSSK